MFFLKFATALVDLLFIGNTWIWGSGYLSSSTYEFKCGANFLQGIDVSAHKNYSKNNYFILMHSTEEFFLFKWACFSGFLWELPAPMVDVMDY